MTIPKPVIDVLVKVGIEVLDIVRTLITRKSKRRKKQNE